MNWRMHVHASSSALSPSGVHTANSGPDRFHCSGTVPFAENCRSGHEDGCAGVHHPPGGVHVDSPIDLDGHTETSLPDHPRYMTNLRHNRFDELLSSEP